MKIDRRHRAMKKRWRDPKYRRKMFKASRRTMLRLHRDPEFRTMMSKISSRTMGETNRDPEFKRKLRLRQSRRLKLQWKDPSFRKARVRDARRRMIAYNKSAEGRASARRNMLVKRHDPNFVAALKLKPSKPQKTIFERLRERGIRHLKMEYFVKPYSLDIVHLKTKTNIETDGVYAHKNRKTKDGARDEYLRRLGWKVIRISVSTVSEAEIYNLEKLVRKLR